MNDLSFDRKMARGYKTDQGIDKEVWTARFFSNVHGQRASPIGVQNFVFAANDLGSGFGLRGVRVILSRRREACRRYWVCAPSSWRTSSPSSTLRKSKTRCVTNPCKSHNGRSWVAVFKDLIKKPEETAAELKLNFDRLVDWQHVHASYSPPSLEVASSDAHLCAPVLRRPFTLCNPSSPRSLR